MMHASPLRKSNISLTPSDIVPRQLECAADTCSKSIVIALVGDSTVADYSLAEPLRGWGQMLPQLLKPSATVVNYAVNGKSTKTFREIGNWEKLIAQKPRYVFIQFGHNDSHPSSQPESTAADGDFRTNLLAYISEARDVGIAPVLVTPMHRRTFSSGKLTCELAPYATSVKEVGLASGVPVIDLYALSGSLFESLGEEGSSGITRDEDRTHFTEKGATEMAVLIAHELPKIDAVLAEVVVEPFPTDKRFCGTTSNKC